MRSLSCWPQSCCGSVQTLLASAGLRREPEVVGLERSYRRRARNDICEVYVHNMRDSDRFADSPDSGPRSWDLISKRCVMDGDGARDVIETTVHNAGLAFLTFPTTIHEVLRTPLQPLSSLPLGLPAGRRWARWTVPPLPCVVSR